MSLLGPIPPRSGSGEKAESSEKTTALIEANPRDKMLIMIEEQKIELREAEKEENSARKAWRIHERKDKRFKRLLQLNRNSFLTIAWRISGFCSDDIRRLSPDDFCQLEAIIVEKAKWRARLSILTCPVFLALVSSIWEARYMDNGKARTNPSRYYFKTKKALQKIQGDGYLLSLKNRL